MEQEVFGELVDEGDAGGFGAVDGGEDENCVAAGAEGEIFEGAFLYRPTTDAALSDGFSNDLRGERVNGKRGLAAGEKGQSNREW